MTLEPVVTTTHRTLRTPAGDLPPTGKTISIPYCNVLKIEAGRISSAHIYVDQLGFMAQLGLLHVFEFRDGLIFRENVWLDAASAIAQLTES